MYDVPGFDDLSGADDLGLAWDAAERYAVTLLRDALPDAQAEPVPAGELADQAARFRAAARKRPYKQLARAAWGKRPPASDVDLWLEAAGALATMRRHIGVDAPLLEPVTLLRPADWVGAVIGVVRSGVNSVVMVEDLVRYARRCPDAEEPGDDAYDPFTGGAVDDDSLRLGFETVLRIWEGIGAVNELQWLTRLGLWGLPRALARAWNGDFDQAAWVSSAEFAGKECTWTGEAPSLADLGIKDPPLAS